MLNRRATPAVAGAFFTGALLGAATSGLALVVLAGLLSPVPATARSILAIVAVGIVALRALGLISFPLPQNARQIPEHAFAAAPRTAAFRFAYELGTSVRTYITKEAVYAVAVLFALLSPRGLGSALVAMVLLACGFALGRSLIVIGQTWRDAAITAHPNWALRAANLGTLAICAVYAVTTLVG